MKTFAFTLLVATLLVGCSRQDTGMGSSPNIDTGMAQQNTVVNAQPDTPNGITNDTVDPAQDSEATSSDTK